MKVDEIKKLEKAIEKLKMSSSEKEPLEEKVKDDKKKKKKSFFERLFNKNKLKKPRKVAVIYLRNNGNAETMELEPDKNGFFTIETKTYHEDSDCMYSMITSSKERYPLAIIPEWNLTPLGNRNWYDRKPQERLATLQDHAMKGIRHAERVRMGEKEESKFNPKTIIIIAIAIVIVGAAFMGFGGG